MTPTPIVPAMKPSASPEREELRKIIGDNCIKGGPIHYSEEWIADAILAAGFRRVATKEVPEGGRRKESVVMQFLDKAYPAKVYADGSGPGAYLCRCVSCTTMFIGHKRDPSCGACPPAPDDNDKAREGTL